MELDARNGAAIIITVAVCYTLVFGLEDCDTNECLQTICKEKGTGYYSHPTQKNKFLQCHDGKVHIVNCYKPDLEWSDELKTCNYATESKGKTFQSACKKGEYLPHSTDCAQYIQCSNDGFGVSRPCAPGTIWDSANNVCNHGNAVTCEIGGSNPGLICDENLCKNGGVCSQNGHTVQCECQSGYTGKYCEQKLPRSCNEVITEVLKKVKKGKLLKRGQYVIYNKQDQAFKVFCEVHGKYGYTFISKPDDGVAIDIDELYEPSTHVIVRHLRSNGHQYDSIFEQMSSQSSLLLSVQYNAYENYNRPINAAHMDPYLYLGFLPKTVVAKKSRQGYRVNGEDATFRNCDANPNSYLVFYFNNKNSDPQGYYKRCCYTSLMRTWINKGKPVNAGDYLPSDYFLQFEMHMGGCGGYAVNGYKSLSDIVGASLGLPFELPACPQQANGIFPDLTDCTKFNMCAHGTLSPASPIQCPNGTLFDPNISNCNWATNELKDRYCS